MIDIEPFARLVSADHGLAVAALALPDGTAHTSVTNAGVLAHPVSGDPVVGGCGCCCCGRSSPPPAATTTTTRSTTA
jgi:hypothetical protein